MPPRARTIPQSVKKANEFLKANNLDCNAENIAKFPNDIRGQATAAFRSKLKHMPVAVVETTKNLLKTDAERRRELASFSSLRRWPI